MSLIEKDEFYSNNKVEKSEWWLAWGSEYPDLYWARLRLFSNGMADVLFQDEVKTYGFENSEVGGYFISEDEFSKFENMDEVFKDELKIPNEIIVKTPDWGDKEVNNFVYIGKY